MEFRKEYFYSPYYFYLKEGKNDISLYFSVSNTLTEARKKDEVIKFKKNQKEPLKVTLKNISKEKKLKSTEDVKKHLTKKKKELDELVDSDGTMLSSKIPIYNPYLSPKKTTDQEVVATRQTNNPVTRGYRVYWGEGEEKDGEVVSEIDLSGSFGREETEDLNGPETFDTYVKDLGMSVDDAKERTRQQGKIPDKKEHKKKLSRVPKEIKDDPNYVDTITLVEKRKTKALQMVEDILLKDKETEKGIGKKNPTVHSLITKNLESLKKLAKKEGISINDLIKILKK